MSEGLDQGAEKVEKSRVARKRARNRAELLKAAQQVFVRRGFHEATIAEITEQADVAVGTFYLHFSDKETAFNAVVDEGFKTICDQLLAATSALPGEKKLSGLVERLLQLAFVQRELFLLLLTVPSSFARLRRLNAKSGLTELISQALPTTTEAQQSTSGEYEKSLQAHLITGILIQAISWWFEQTGPAPEVMAQHVLHLLHCGISNQQLLSQDKLAD